MCDFKSKLDTRWNGGNTTQAVIEERKEYKYIMKIMEFSDYPSLLLMLKTECRLITPTLFIHLRSQLLLVCNYNVGGVTVPGNKGHMALLG